MKDVQLKLAVNYVILVLNWLAMGETLMKVDGLGLGAKLRAKQWEVVHRIIPSCEPWWTTKPSTLSAWAGQQPRWRRLSRRLRRQSRTEEI